ncbi:Histone-binding protein RBBP4/subunit C of CAF1 complex family protein [Babesia bovis T2Bo]|uniref:Retinoblastoma A associated protein, putative n=1 Tax=Babesia bovis TaxID=5865 RepID=A7ASD8_BABBO|nr:Histone-binding protein RBBP4/subunit C of CAF1 complex family protein [Babesia bovis T2Bo]EDO07457.1 Histone-binding protein RBBP4/subunit C of CAF1 complex family protein [Babesia bovis T2Bo]BAN66013.1 retinoblastoma A associated protein, putative [Babesia bovis]|eukprot:XP_001611025.1 retinoblastoma A associated protein [Babesia bovis T2Bo]
MESVILRGNALCKIKRRFPAPPLPTIQPSTPIINDNPRLDENAFDSGREQEDEYDNYYVWRRNAPFLYDTVLVHRLDWPSLVVDFVSDTCYKSRNGATAHKVLLGTHTSGNDVEYAIVAEMKLPVTSIRENLSSCENFTKFFSYHKTHKIALMGHPLPSLDIKAKLVHPGEVNRISHCPGRQFTFATHTTFGDLLVYDYSRHPSTPRSATKAAPQLVLTGGHSADGFGISWMSDMKLVSVATDGSVCTWDINASSMNIEDTGRYLENTKCVKPLTKFNLKDTPFNDVQVVPTKRDLFMTVADDYIARLYDSRQDNSGGTPQMQLKSESEVNCLSFNQFKDDVVATGEADGTVCIWDMRYPNEPMLLLDHHKEAVNQVEFCPASAGLLASASQDNKVCIWELSAEERLRFVHAGHRAAVSDLSWLKAASMKNGFTLATTGADNEFHCFVPNFTEL